MSMLHLPIEVLHRILEYVPEPEDRDVWLSSMVNTAMLLPISQTCRRLRDITISHSALWQSLKIGDRVEPKARGLVQDALARSRSRSLNLDLSLSSCEENDATWTHTKSLRPEVAARVRELQIFLTSKRVDHPWDPVFDRAYPHLDSFSFYDVTEDTVLTHFPPFTENSSSRLRRLYLRVVVALPQCEFPMLTHLALEDVAVKHGSIIELLGRCPNLESLIIRNIWQRSIPNAASQAQDLSGSLPRLRRVLLQDLRDTFLPFYLQKLPKHPQGYSLQVAGVTAFKRFCDARAILHGHSVGPVRTIYIRSELSQWNPAEAAEFYAPSVAFLSAQSVVRVGTSIRLAAPLSAVFGPDRLRHTLRDKAALQSVSEVWVVNFRTDWWDACAEPLRTTIAALPALEIISIVMDQSRGCGEPDLRILPDGRDPAFDSPRFRIARLVYGYDRDVEYRRIVDSGQYGDLLKPRETKQLSLSRVIEQLRTGAFEYLDRLVLCAASHLMFDEAEVEQLRGYVPQLDVEYSDVTPGVLLPEYAREPEASGHLEYWNGCFH